MAEGERTAKSEINPSSMGAEFLLRKEDFPTEIELQISFNVYYRCFPRFKEEKEYIQEKDVDPENLNEPLKDVFQRNSFSSSHSLKLSKLSEAEISSRAFKEDLESLKHQIRNQPHLFRNAGSTNVSNYELRNKEEFEVYLSDRDGKIPELPWDLDLKLKVREFDEEKVLVRVILENKSRRRKGGKQHDPTFFDVEMNIQANFQAFQSQFLKEGTDIEEEKAEYLDMEAKGINCVAYSENGIIKARQMPKIVQRRTQPASTSFSFDELTKAPVPCLEEVLKDMKSYVERKEGDITTDKELMKVEEFKEKEINKFSEGIDFLVANNRAMRAFKLMNEVVKRATDFQKWYKYQLVFIVSQLNSVKGSRLDETEVLRVPTGGGKTFCYLGLLIFASFYERLAGKETGVTGWIKFPLRMLSLQQLEIISRFVCHANEVKNENEIQGEDISVGYLVGGSNTPNRIFTKYGKGAKEEIKEGEDFRIVHECPFCGSEVELGCDERDRKVYHCCSNPECERGERLPIYAVDYEIYRRLPTLVVSTLDKVVTLNYNDRPRSLLGGEVKEKCEEGLGYNPRERCLYGFEDFDRREEGESCPFYEDGSCSKEPLGRFAPTFLIQDEMHLIRGSHGSMDSLMETLIEKTTSALKESCREPTSWENHSFKVITPTATVSGARQQVKNLYGKKGNVFPTRFRTDDFYFEETEEIHRIIMGVMPHNRAINWSVWQIIGEIWKIVQSMYNKSEEWSKEVGIPPEKLKKIIEKKYSTIVAYHRSRKEAESLPEGIQSIVNEDLRKTGTSPIPKADIEVLTSERTLDEIRELMDRIETEKLSEKIKTISATKAISHGIDFDELNIMIFQGVPRSVSEYIQAMSRVGRRDPAIIFNVYHGYRARDHSFYQYFKSIHQVINDLVENVPLSRWPKKVVKKMTPMGILTSLHTIFAERNDRSYISNWDLLNSSNEEVNSEMVRDFLIAGFEVKDVPEPFYEEGEFENTIERMTERFFDGARYVDGSKFLSEIVEEQFDASLRGFRGSRKSVELLPKNNALRKLWNERRVKSESPATEDLKTDVEEETLAYDVENQEGE